MFGIGMKKLFVLVIFTTVISCSLILYKNLKRFTRKKVSLPSGDHNKNIKNDEHNPSLTFYDETTKGLMIPSNGSTIRTNASTARQRRRLFDKYGLTNLKMFQPLDPPRQLFQFVMEPRSIRAQVPDELQGKEFKCTMIVAIKSHYMRMDEREKIRNSWGAIRYLNGIRMEVIFVIAYPETQKIQTDLGIENKRFGDLLQVQMNETYRDIGLKALASMQWISDHFPTNYLYFSGDDDVMPGFENLPSVLGKMISKANDSGYFEMKLPIFCAYIYGDNMEPHRKGKWSVNEELYPPKVYPPMCFGGFYGMSIKLAKSIYIASRYYPYFQMDDVFITGFMRLKVCDTFKDGEFQFEREIETCAIATFKCPGFSHEDITKEKFLKKWATREEYLISNGAEIVKIQRR